jgi:hypothetical protein
MVGDRYAMSVTAQIMEHMLWPPEGAFRVDHPVVSEQFSEPRGKSLRLSKERQISVESQPAVAKGAPLLSFWHTACQLRAPFYFRFSPILWQFETSISRSLLPMHGVGYRCGKGTVASGTSATVDCLRPSPAEAKIWLFIKILVSSRIMTHSMPLKLPANI